MKLCILANATNQPQELPLRGRPVVPPGGRSVPLDEADMASDGIVRALARSRFSVVERFDLPGAPEVEPEPAPDGDAPPRARRRRGSQA